MDMQTEQAVWRRVKAPGNVTAEEAVLPERLEAMILEQRTEAAALRAVSRRLRGSNSATASRVASGIDARIRELTTMHYLLTGRQLRLQTPRPAPTVPLPEALRDICLRLRQTARAYDSLQTEFADYSGDFSRLAADARIYNRTMTDVLRQQLHAKAL